MPEYAIAFHAVASLGATVTTLNPLYTAEEIAFQLKDSGAVALLTVTAFEEKARAAMAHEATAGKIGRLYLFDGKAEEGDTTPFSALLSGGDAHFPASVAIDAANDLVAIPYSSGTSGLPKGVKLTHKNIVANIMQITAETVKLTPDDTLVGVLPFFHIYAMVVILNVSLRCGARTVTMPKFDPPLFLKVLKEHSVTVGHVAPPLVGFLAKHPAVDQVLPLPALRELFCGAAPLGADLAAAACKRLELGDGIRQGYGMTEMSPASHIAPIGTEDVGSIGQVLPGMVAKLVSTETGKPVGEGERGELWLSGPNIMAGYLNNEAATKETIDVDGFLHTGDVGYIDSKGFFFIVDRVKELIKVKGFQVAPAELEAVLLTSAAIADAAVIGVADAKAGELPKAYVVRQKGHEGLTEEQVKEHVAGKVAEYKQVALVEFVESVPKSAAGKILRKELRKMEEERRQK